MVLSSSVGLHEECGQEHPIRTGQAEGGVVGEHPSCWT